MKILKLNLPDLVKSIGGVWNQLTEKNFFVWVKCVDDQTHELSDLGLKCKGFNFFCHLVWYFLTVRCICVTTDDALLQPGIVGDLFWDCGECSRTGEHSRLCQIILPAEMTPHMLWGRSLTLTCRPRYEAAKFRSADTGESCSRKQNSGEDSELILEWPEHHFSLNKYLST